MLQSCHDHFNDKETPISEITIERTHCLGTCPEYAAIIRKDGSIEYQGRNHVGYIGTRSGKVRHELFRMLARQATDIGYFDFADRYTCTVTDNPTVITSVVRSGERKLVSNYAASGPPRLGMFEYMVDIVLGEATWQATSPALSPKGAGAGAPVEH